MPKPFVLPPPGMDIALRPKLPPGAPVDFGGQPFDRVRRALIACGVTHTDQQCLALAIRILSHAGVCGDVRATGSKDSLTALREKRRAFHLVVNHQKSKGLPCEGLETSLAEIENELKRLTALGAQTTWAKPGRGKNYLGGTRRRALGDILRYLRIHFPSLSSKERAQTLLSLCGVLRLFPFDEIPTTETLREIDRKHRDPLPQH